MPDVVEWRRVDEWHRCAVVGFPAETVGGCVPEIREQMLVALNRGADALVADLSATRFCARAALDALLRARVRADAMHTPMGLVLPESGPVREAVDVSGVTRLFPHDTSVPSLAGRWWPQVSPPSAR